MTERRCKLFVLDLYLGNPLYCTLVAGGEENFRFLFIIFIFYVAFLLLT